VIAFPSQDPQPVAEAMLAEFSQAGLTAEVFISKISEIGAQVLSSGQ
jgi:hypothetical protein